MPAKHRIQRYYDFLRGKGTWGAGIELEGPLPLHYGSRYIYRSSEAQPIIKRLVESDAPCFIPRPGLTEQRILFEFLDSLQKPSRTFSDRWRRNISILSGFFTPTDEQLIRFCCEMLEMLRDADAFGAFGQFTGSPEKRFSANNIWLPKPLSAKTVRRYL